jgi:hypothetical protein
MQQSAIIALFLSSANTMTLNTNGGVRFISEPSSFAEVTNMAAAKSGSGVRARWIELPNCSKWNGFLDVTTGKAAAPAIAGQPTEEYIPLRDDLANAIIATCKGAEPTWGPIVAAAADTAPAADTSSDQSWTAKAASVIFDPVVKTATVIPDQEH